MRVRDSKVTAALLAAVVVVGGVNVAAYAGNGHAFLLGRHNTETKPSVVKNKHKGPALTLHTKKSSPPLKVTSKRKVKRLNADTVDGKSAGALETRAWRFTLSGSGATSYDWYLPALPKGFYLVSLRVRPNFSPGPQCQIDLNDITGSGKEFNPVNGFVNGTALIDDHIGVRLHLSCFSVNTWSVWPGSQVSLIRMDHVTSAALHPTS